MMRHKFLIVDDDVSFARALARELKAFGPCIIAHDAETAKVHLGEPAGWLGFIVDAHLGTESGLDVLRAARNTHPNVPALVVSASADVSLPNRAYALGANFLHKPAEPELFRQFAASATNGAPPGSSEVSALAPTAVELGARARSRFLVIDLETRVRDTLEQALPGWSAAHTGSFAEATRLLESDRFGTIFVNLSLRHMPEQALFLESLRGLCPGAKTVVGGMNFSLAVALMRVERDGSDDAAAIQEFQTELRRVLGHPAAVADPPRRAAPKGGAPGGMARVYALADRIARTPRSPALIIGESGVGKEVLASRIHAQSERRGGPFVKLNVAAISASMLEAELFGSVRGAFTDARRDREGLLATAHGGSILLDEIGEVRLELQAKLLRVIERKSFFPVGSDRERSIDVRIIAATNFDPQKALASGAFRSDLFYRLGTVICIPPLRERRDEIIPLAERFIAEICTEFGRPPARLSGEAERMLLAYSWPGNVRELRNVVERALLLGSDSTLGPELFDLAPDAGPTAVAAPSASTRLPDAARAAERSAICAALEESGWSTALAAKKLGIGRSTLYEKMKKHGIQ